MSKGKVYIIQCGDTRYYKIGLTKDPVMKRLRELQTGNPYRLYARLAIDVEDMGIAEDILHRRYFQQRGLGEWFYVDPQGRFPLSIDEITDYVIHELREEVRFRLLLKELQCS